MHFHFREEVSEISLDKWLTLYKFPNYVFFLDFMI